MAGGGYRGGSTIVHAGSLAKQGVGPVTPIEAARDAVAAKLQQEQRQRDENRQQREFAQSLPPYEMDEEEARFWQEYQG